MSHGPFFWMEPVNLVFPGEGRWLTGDASAQAPEETGVQSDLIRTLQTTFQQSLKFFFGLEDCMLSFWSLCSRSLMYSSSVEELVLLKEDHQKDINSTVVRLPIFVLGSKIVSLRQMWLLSLSRTCFQVSSVWCFATVLGGTETMGLTLNGKEWHSRSTSTRSKRARGESVTSWINRSDEALMDMRKKLATAPGANSSESTMIPPQIQGWLLLHRARLRDQDIVGVMTITGGSLNIKLVEKSLLDLFTDDVLQSVDRFHGKDSGNPRTQHAFEEVEEVPEDDDDTYLDEDFSENDDPYIDEDGNFLQTSKSCLTLTMTWPLMMKNTTKHSLVIVRHEIS